jgi:6-pyruvoyltetrahydropterin/6-carboxytetrahydropterin synthase
MTREPRYRIRVARELFKFSSAHMTVFPDGRKERLHGHNYGMAVQLELADASFERMVDFAAIKQAGRAFALRLRERVLLAEQNRHFEVVRQDDVELEFRLAGKRYVLPREDVLLLPIDNVSTEALAGYASAVLGEELRAALPAGAVTGIEVTVEESPGQGATCYRPLG